MKKIIIYAALLLIPSVGLSQETKGDKMASVGDTAKVNSLIKEAKPFFTSDETKAFALSREALALAKKIGFSTGEAYAYKNLGIIYYFHNKYLEALENYNSSLEIFQDIKDNVGIANLQNNIGAIYYDRGDYAKALEYYLQSLKYSELVGDQLRILSALNNIGGVYSIKPATKDKALQYYSRALKLCEELGMQAELGAISANLGAIYYDKKDDQKALFYFKKSLQAYGNTEGGLNAHNALGKLYSRQGKYDLAILHHNKALELAKKQDNKLSIAQSLMGTGNVFMKRGDFQNALNYYKMAEVPASLVEPNDDIKDLYNQMAISYNKTGDFENAFKYQGIFANIKDTIYNLETDKKLGSLQFDFDLQKKEGEINLLTKDKALAELSVRRQTLARNAFAGGLVLVFFIAILLYRNYRIKAKTNRLLDHQKQQIEHLLLNILPVEVAQELQVSGEATPRDYESVSVLFTDFKGFTRLTENMNPALLVKELNNCFIAFDRIIGKYNLEKIKTIGDSYMCAGGIPTPDINHVDNMILASLEIQEYITENNNRKVAAGLAPWELRIGIHVGPVVAGVVGKRKYAYDISGSTVNIASRMESNGLPGRVNISATTYELIKDKFACTYRGKIHAKNVGDIDMYFVEGEHRSAIPTRNKEVVSEESVLLVT